MKNDFKLVVRSNYLVEAIRSDGKVVGTYKLNATELPEGLRAACVLAFCTHWGHCSLNTLRTKAQHILAFAIAAKAAGVNKLPMPAESLNQLRAYLASRGYADATCQGTLNSWKRLLSWILRNSPSLLETEFSLRCLPFKVDVTRRVPSKLDEHGLKKIMDACYSDIEYATQLLKWGRDLLEGNEVDVPDHLKQAATTLREWSKSGPPSIPISKAIPRSVWNKTSSQEVGRRMATSMVYLTPRTILPFYIAILAQTSGNPSDIWELTVECIQAHVRNDVEVIVWVKDRAGRQQKADFPKDRQWAAPSLVRLLLFLSKDLRKVCGKDIADRLFLSWAHDGPGCPATHSLHYELNQFIKRHQLPDFNFVDFRRLVGKVAHKAGGTIHAAQKRLNHRSSATTVRYSPLGDLGGEHSSRIASYQGLMVAMSRKESDLNSKCVPSSPSSQRARTVFGFDCADPFSGAGGYSPRGSRCLKFNKCGSCPGSVVVLDDVGMVSRLLSTSLALKEAKTRSMVEGWAHRFEALYQETQSVLDNEILPMVADEILEKARLEIGKWQIPHIE